MNEYEYTDPDGDIFRIAGYNEESVMQVITKGVCRGARIPNADVPTVAAELLKAAGHEATILPKTTDIVRETPDGFVIGFGKSTTIPATLSPENMRIFAAHYIAVAEYIENKGQRETEAATKLQERRDKIALDLSGGATRYSEFVQGPFLKAIDRIIELEDGK